MCLENCGKHLAGSLLVPQQSPYLELAAVFIMQFQVKYLFTGDQDLIIISKLINIACNLHAIVPLQGSADLIHGKLKVQLRLKHTHQCKRYEANDKMSIDLLLGPDEGGGRIILALGSTEDRFHMSETAVKPVGRQAVCFQIAGHNSGITIQLHTPAPAGGFPGKTLLSGLKLMIVHKLFLFILINPFFI